MKVELHIKRAGNLNTFVKELNIPDFQRMPEAIAWGSRIFFLRKDRKTKQYKYIEGLIYVHTAIEKEELKQKGEL